MYTSIKHDKKLTFLVYTDFTVPYYKENNHTANTIQLFLYAGLLQ